jgi:hypothetical protein
VRFSDEMDKLHSRAKSTPKTGPQRLYTVSKDEHGNWYAHMRSYPYVPVFGSIGSKARAQRVARLMNETV